jgi:hypothetical protein
LAWGRVLVGLGFRAVTLPLMRSEFSAGGNRGCAERGSG